MTCTHTLGSLTCTRPAGHEHGHVYVSSSGSHLDDRHEEGGHG